VEYLFPYRYPPFVLKRQLDHNDLRQVMFNLHCGDWEWGDRGIAADPGLVDGFGWATCGVWTHQPCVTLATGASAVIFALITGSALQFGRRVREFRIAPVWLAVLPLGCLFAGVKWLAFVLPVSVLAANLPQVWIAHKEANLADLSLGTWMLSMGDGLVWGLCTLFHHDDAIRVFALFQLTTSGMIVAMKLAHGRKRSPLIPASGRK
jgi:hypothetical protein